ncbi:glycosyltransferase family protein [Terricaulis silvestris]|uniref:Putative glycosyl transferase n=1 Tax=Terricaulis silvestris TaxID=2686094 RepID=A0A6I6MQF1_9CAUL|nr:hypothetical protein [Terricaulis silvestris]QGZ93393.1 putative glycosyl transferase [Terricaulis silvestris]
MTTPVAPELLPLIIVCDWIPPEFGAVGQYQLAEAQRAAAAGRKVTLIGLGRASERSFENCGEGELTVVRIARATPNKKNLLERAFWALSANFALIAAMGKATRGKGACEIKVTGSPPFLSYLVLLRAMFIRSHRITYRITDFYPETAIASGKAHWLKPLARVFHALRRRADRIEALSDCQKVRLVESGVDLSRVAIVRDGSPVTFSSRTIPAERPFEAKDIVLLYSGNLGVAHDWRTFAEAYRLHVHTGSNRVRLWLNATGTGVAPLKAFCDAHKLPVHHTQPAPVEALAGVLLAADAHLILLGDSFWGYVIPSKIYGCVASGRPCLYVGPEESDLHVLVSVDGRHHSIRSNDVSGVERVLASLEQSRAITVS